MVPIKICGLKRANDIAIINECKPEYAGFVFAPSRRNISIDLAKELIAMLHGVRSAGVFVNENIGTICHIAESVHLDIIQLHGEESEAEIQYLKHATSCEIWKALRIGTIEDLILMKQLHPDRFLLDSFQKDAHGGTGQRIKKELLNHVDTSNVILAGGINNSNIKEILAYKPYAIDVSSGVETNGIKDPFKIKQLIREVRT